MAKNDWLTLGYTETQAEYLESVENLNRFGYNNGTEDLKSASEILVETMQQYDLDNDETNKIIDKLNQIPN